MVHITIVEDETHFVGQLRDFLTRYQKERGVKLKTDWFSDGEAVVENYPSSTDILLMDIQLPYLDGMTSAELIRGKDPEVIIIFITNMTQYAIKGYTVGAMDYLVKPLSYFALSQRLDKAIAKMQKRERKYLVVASAGQARKLDVSQICYIESSGHNLTFQMVDTSFSVPGTMTQMERELAGNSFYRCNKGCLVNLEHVDGIQDNCALVGNVHLPISRGKKAGMMAALTDYVNGVMP
ncbi:MAG: LytTR family DNA-binding domain-containing protein [Oscillospiraceae bacterium]|nr:LytTR family DNA-binding domain-containing protein [Oscillospiraceae bacterium]